MAFKLQFVTVNTDNNKRRVLDTLVLDASLSEVHESDADVTEFPVEEGSDVSDNVRQKPKGLLVEALISDFHLANDGRSQASSGGPTSSQRPLAGAVDDSKVALAKLESYQKTGTLIDVETGLKSYRNMVIQSIRTPRDKNLKKAVKCTITLKSIQIVKTQTVLITQSEPKGQGEVPKGQKTPTPADSGKENQSLAFKSQNVPESLKKSLDEAAAALRANFGF